MDFWLSKESWGVDLHLGKAAGLRSALQGQNEERIKLRDLKRVK